MGAAPQTPLRHRDQPLRALWRSGQDHRQHRRSASHRQNSRASAAQRCRPPAATPGASTANGVRGSFRLTTAAPQRRPAAVRPGSPLCAGTRPKTSRMIPIDLEMLNSTVRWRHNAPRSTRLARFRRSMWLDAEFASRRRSGFMLTIRRGRFTATDASSRRPSSPRQDTPASRAHA